MPVIAAAVADSVTPTIAQRREGEIAVASQSEEV